MTDWLAEKAHTKAHAKKGKSLEKRIHDLLNTRADIDFERNYDAAASRGMMTVARVGDFTWYGAARHGVIEAKEISSGTRLPYTRLSQYASLHKRSIYGGSCYVLIHAVHIDRYYTATISQLRKLRNESLMKSWALSDLTAHPTLEDAIMTCLEK